MKNSPSPPKSVPATPSVSTAPANTAGWQTHPAAPGAWTEAGQCLLWFAVTAVALAWIFPPYGIWPLGFVALAPWAMAVCRTRRGWLVHWLGFGVGWVFFLVCLRWLMPVTGLGFVALAFYLGIYWTLAGWALRTGRRHGVAVVWTLPMVWVACEYLRATVMSGFPWLFVSHAFYEQLPLIQISDIAGAYGVTFVATFFSGVLAEWWLHLQRSGEVRPLWRQVRIGTSAAVVLLGLTIAYGYYRLAEVDFANDPQALGPRIAVVQHDFPLTSTPPYGAPSQEVLASYLALAAQALAADPDLVAFPETTWAGYQNIAFIEQRERVSEVTPGMWDWSVRCHAAVSAFARGDYAAVNAVIAELEAMQQQQFTRRLQRDPTAALSPPAPLPRLPELGRGVTTLVGSVSLEQYPEATYPKMRTYNSALVYDADGQQRRERYDKTHLVPFGEFVPFRQAHLFGLDLHWLYRWLNSLSPFSFGGTKEYSLTHGTVYTAFELTTERGTFRFGTPICYEGVTPYVIRRFVWDGPRRRVDFLVNMSNDGWFQHSVELPQHLAAYVFRAIENRIGIARAVNTGISGFVDPNGRIYARVTDAEGRSLRLGRGGIIGVATQPVYLDQRATIYGRFGDWFAHLCLLAAAILWLSGIFERWVLALQHRLQALLRRRSPAGGRKP